MSKNTVLIDETAELVRSAVAVNDYPVEERAIKAQLANTMATLALVQGMDQLIEVLAATHEGRPIIDFAEEE